MNELDMISDKYCKEYWAEQDKEALEVLAKENRALKELLKGKDIQIKELQEDNRELRKGLNKSGLDYFINSLNSIRHEVCDKIRSYIDKEVYDRFGDDEAEYLTINLEEFEDLLQDLEQGEGGKR